jgi:hypothetical protein
MRATTLNALPIFTVLAGLACSKPPAPSTTPDTTPPAAPSSPKESTPDTSMKESTSDTSVAKALDEGTGTTSADAAIAPEDVKAAEDVVVPLSPRTEKLGVDRESACKAIEASTLKTLESVLEPVTGESARAEVKPLTRSLASIREAGLNREELEMANAFRKDFEVGRCILSPDDPGAWLISVDKAIPDVGLEVNLTRITPDGQANRLEIDNVFNNQVNFDFRALGRDYWSVERISDLDGDGDTDVLIRAYTRGPDVSRSSFLLYRATDGKAEPWMLEGSRGPSNTFQLAQDVDGDGRLDLIHTAVFKRSPFGDDETLGLGILFRSTPTGFSTDDKVVKDWYRKKCGGKKLTLDTKLDYTEQFNRYMHIICARLWGATAKEAERALRMMMHDEGALTLEEVDAVLPDTEPFMNWLKVQLD